MKDMSEQEGTEDQSMWISAFLCTAWRRQSPQATDPKDRILTNPIWVYSRLWTLIQVEHDNHVLHLVKILY